MNWMAWTWGLPLVALSLPVLVLLLQVLMAFRSLNTRRDDPRPCGLGAGENSPRLAVLVPAHDEAAGIVRTLHNLKLHIGAHDRILVVADNCADDTAVLARACGVEVIERSHATRRGKGYALDFGIRHLAADPPDVLVIVDADCIVTAGTLRQIARLALAYGRPVQAQDLMHAPAAAGMKQRVAEFAWRVKNLVRPLGWHALGLPCQLMGTGMAFPWSLASRMSLANGNIVEDMKLGIDFALQGAAPLFCPDVLVSSQFPAAARAQRSQRKRWEHGHLGMIVGEAPRLLVHAAQRGSLAALALALDLIVPPLALLAALLATALLLAMGYYAAVGGAWAAAWAATLCTLFAASVLLAWHGWGRQVVSFRELLAIPVYILEKVPLYLGFLAKRQKDWVRTGRR
jgi:cellulose synthase/poly-beta-1,6-N-acetylglucosamine synthase-like glycosyltransferase